MTAAQAVDWYCCGLGLVESARRGHVSRPTLLDALHEAGIPIEHRELRYRITLPDNLAARYADGASVNALALEYGVERRVVRRVLTEAGVALRPHPHQRA